MKNPLILQAALLVSLVGCSSEKVKTDPQLKDDNSSSKCNVPGCSSDSLPKGPPVIPSPVGVDRNSIPPRPRPPGSDRDSNGCIPSAGSLWCAKTNSCQSPLALAKKEGFIGAAGISETRKAFEVYCRN